MNKELKIYVNDEEGDGNYYGYHGLILIGNEGNTLHSLSGCLMKNITRYKNEIGYNKYFTNSTFRPLRNDESLEFNTLYDGIKMIGSDKLFVKSVDGTSYDNCLIDVKNKFIKSIPNEGISTLFKENPIKLKLSNKGIKGFHIFKHILSPKYSQWNNDIIISTESVDGDPFIIGCRISDGGTTGYGVWTSNLFEKISSVEIDIPCDIVEFRNNNNNILVNGSGGGENCVIDMKNGNIITHEVDLYKNNNPLSIILRNV